MKFLIFCLAFTSFSYAGDLEDILKTHLQSLGGVDAIEAIESMKVKAKMVVETPQGSMELPMSIYADKNRVYINTNFQGMEMIQCINGDKGWTTNPMMGPDPVDMTEKQIRSLKVMTDTGGDFYKHKDKGHTLKYLGKEDVEGTEAHKIEVTTKDGDVRTHFLDTEYCLVIRTDSENEQMGQTFKAQSYPGDYKAVNGVMIPHSNRIAVGPQSMNMIFESFEVGATIDDAVFEKPKKPEAAAPEKN